MLKKLMFTILIILLVIGLFYLYLIFASQKKYPVEYGISFNKGHADFIGLDWRETYLAMLKDLKPKYLRLAATWREVEGIKGKYDDVDVAWQMDKAKEHNAKVTLVVGQKAPRWPECHVPAWTDGLTDTEYKLALFAYIKNQVELYRNHPALEFWQVENEAFIRFVFGECKNFRNDFINEEINLVRELDPDHPIIMTDSGELSTWHQAIKAGDIFGTTLYRIVRTPSGMVWTYDWLPASFYRFKAQFWGKNINEVFVSELQAEPWFSAGNPNTTSLDEQEKTMNLSRLEKHFAYVERIGVPRAYLWGVEWWYWMKDKQGDNKYWEMVKTKIAE